MSAAKNVQLQGVKKAQRGLENSNGIVRRDTIDSITVNNLTVDQDVENDVSNSDKMLIIIWIKRIILIVICVVVAGGFSVPIVIYYTEADRGIDNPTISAINLNIDNCPTAASMNYSMQSKGISLYGEKCINYNGVCKQYLPLGHLTNITSLSTLVHNEISEADVVNSINTIKQYSNFFSKQCDMTDIVLPFMCQYVYPPCNGNNVSAAQLISHIQCENIRDRVCATEWRLVTTVSASLSSMLPTCEDFKDTDLDLEFSHNSSQDMSQPLQCHYQFKEFCGLCLPLCGKFSQYKVETKVREKSVLILSGSSAVIGAILVFIATIVRRKRLMTFPSVLIVYNTFCAFIIACLVLITYLGGQERLYCTHEALNVAYENPSLFCQFSGFVFHWALPLLAMFWLLHLMHLFVKITFPIWSRKLSNRTNKMLHIAEVTGATIICGITPVIFISTSEYNFHNFPPFICFPTKSVAFYSLCLPLCLMVGTGVILAIIMFWMLHMRHQLFEKNSSYRYCIAFSVPEAKILVLSCYFIVFGMTALITFSYIIRDSDIIIEKLLIYFACQARGSSSNNTCSTEYDELRSYLKPELNSASYFLLSLVSWSNILYAIQFTDIKNVIQRITRVCRCASEKHSTTYNNTTQL